MTDGWGRPIGYASSSLSMAKINYSQLEHKGAACVFGVKQFHQYLFGHSFDLIMDHKPLLAILNQHKSNSVQALGRIHSWE